MSTQPHEFLHELFGMDQRTVLVTGGSRGIGHAIASGFARAGARVYICARNLADCQAAADELSQFGECIPLQADLSTVEGCRALADTLASREDQLDVLVNNAGATWFEEFAEYPEEQWNNVLDVNARSTFYLTQALVPLLTRGATPEDPARVINVGSIRGYLVPKHPSFAYSASKGAVHQLSRHLASYLAPSSITVNVLAPGVYQSKMRQGDGSRERPPVEPTTIPLGRPGAPLDMAGTALFLASRAGSYLTGTVIPVDGGVGVVPN